MKKTVLCVLFVCALTLSAQTPLVKPAPKPAEAQKLTEVERLQLLVAEKDNVIFTLQQELLNVNSQLVDMRKQAAESAVSQLRSKIGASHDSVVTFDPQTGEPQLAPVTKPTFIPPAKETKPKN